MKILFAVSNENVSDAIVKSYQKNYNDTVTYKNVFYFNAITKEIQRDRSYDRIIISEDLEPFANNNYDAIDKFIYERLDSISNEINSFSDKRIPIILICTDRRTKSSQMITKLFNIGIYDGVIGSDRKIENVCKLINEPRTKENAQQYYKIQNSKDGQTSIEDVSEEEVKNILSYYKKLGKNEDRFTDSFNNIAAQYTDAQLKIIIRYLPINVKAVLEAECQKYQELVTYANNPESAREQREKERLRQQKQIEQEEENERIAEAVKQKQKPERRLFGRKEQKEEKHSAEQYVPNNASASQAKEVARENSIGIDLLDRKLNNQGIQGNVVIPNAINTKEARKALSDEEMNLESNRSIKPEQTVQPQTQAQPQEVSMPQVQPQPTIKEQQSQVQQQRVTQQPQIQSQSQEQNTQRSAENPSNISATLPGFEDLDSLVGGDVVTPVENVAGVEVEKIPETVIPEPANDQVNPNITENIKQVNQEENTEPVKRGRGRPRKNSISEDTVPKPKGKRGRPRKNPIPEENNDTQNNDGLSQVPETQVQPETQIQQGQPSAILPGLEDLATDRNVQAAAESTANETATLPGFETETISEDFSSFDTFETEKAEEPSPEVEPVTTDTASLTFPDFDNDEFENIDNINKQDTNNMINQVTDDFINDTNIESTKTTTLPGMEIEPDDSVVEPVKKDENILQDFDMQNNPESQTTSTLPGFTDEYQDQELTTNVSTATSYRDSENTRRSSMKQLEEKVSYSTGSLENVLTKDKKIVAFIGTSKNGTSFIVNNLASLFSSIGVKTAILDMTKNRNAYYIYTNNDENLRKLSYDAIDNLANGVFEGIKADRNLNVFTAVPNEEKDFSNAEAILTTLAKNESLVLIDCDYDTPLGYFANAQEIYLVQSMDILTIQPLTAFLRELKANGILEPDKLRVVVNKEIKVKGLSSKTIIGGMSFYNDPSMSYMTELFDKNKIKACTLPFEDSTYSKYLETLVNCNVSISGYSKNFMNSLKILGNMVYPLSSKQTYISGPDYSKSNFSEEMNNTLNQMKSKY